MAKLFTKWCRVCLELTDGCVTFERRALVRDREVNWEKSGTLFSNLRATSMGRIETDGAGMLQVISLIFKASRLVSKFVKHCGIFVPDFNEARGDEVAVASAGPCAHRLHFIQIDDHASISSLSSLQNAQPTLSKHWRQLRSYVSLSVCEIWPRDVVALFTFIDCL